MTLVVTHWSVNAAVVAACAVAAMAHLLGMRAAFAAAGPGGGPAALAAGPGGGRAPVVREAAVFHAGLLTVTLALVSPLGYWAQGYVWVRSLQDLLLAVVAPALIVLGAPWLMLARGVRPGPARSARPGPARGALRPRSRRHTAGPAGTGAGIPGGPRALAWLSSPVVATVAFNAGWWGWHAPLPYDAAARNPVVHAAEVVTYLGLGVWFWLQLIGSRPLQPRWPPLRRVTLIAGTVVSNTVLAMVLGFGATVVYPAYRAAPRHALPVVADQQIGGAVLWVLIMPPLVITAVALLLRWLKEEEAAALTAGFDRLLKPPPSAWPRRPGLR